MEYDDGTKARAPDGTALPLGPVLYALNKQIASTCASQNKYFMQCKTEDGNPKSCLRQGEDVKQCVEGVVKRADQQCPKLLTAFARCLDKNHVEFWECRPEQQALEACFPP
ncbi:hypothetical protein T484DRAFT_1960668 [Baffinella frigidus]|nr:hypothetical protein T484DRAFT_1960668 [Cryptophyta sp. CCMP2293]|eukprot:CAMPEP_0180189318 /NCGR_PEP_ID=MMETSP0987-20121128/272_1 /TAXON_ID=697907 /ORGANISM="non described non described, Strain CCMP2293" /LENGTH=110 /DNA_ID=CAMNT_0022143649 /DNA_START=41 /DNA_END=373 /DNA_ORIENTATION=-